MEFDRRKVATLAGTLVLAAAVVAAGIYGPSAWKVFWNKESPQDKVVIQNPPVDQGGSTQGTPAQASGVKPAAGTATAPQGSVTTPPPGDVSGPKKYKEPDTKLMDLAPSISGYFADGSLSEAAATLAFQSAWNIHQYVDGYLFGPNAGPQMNEADIKKYIVFHKSLWDNQIKKEAGAAKAAAFAGYLDILFNKGIDAFDAKDKVRIEQFHQEIHDLDAHLFRNDTNAKIYGATPFATKR